MNRYGVCIRLQGDSSQWYHLDGSKFLSSMTGNIKMFGFKNTRAIWKLAVF